VFIRYFLAWCRQDCFFQWLAAMGVLVLLAACTSSLANRDTKISEADQNAYGDGTADLVIDTGIPPDLDAVGPADQDTASPDQAGLDSTLEEVTDSSDSSGDGEVVLCPSGDGLIGCPCLVDEDCAGGLCTLHLGERRCAGSCDDGCPEWWLCADSPDDGNGSLCMSRHSTACLPCIKTSGCVEQGGGVCFVAAENNSAFCGTKCENETDCPLDYECRGALSTEGVETQLCLPVTGICTCTDYAIEEGLAALCFNKNEWGLCTGERKCLGDGLSDCDASNPDAESCNGKDDNCNEEIDEGDPCEDDGDPCTEENCNDGQCLHPPGNNGSNCDDGDACTLDDFCQDGSCVAEIYDVVCLGACGDGKCVYLEDDNSCPADCGWCGDGVCGLNENGPDGGTCPKDCLAACGDGLCEGGESVLFCQVDCGGCGDGFCGLNESSEICAGDCPPACGDGQCEAGEGPKLCPVDCLPPCGDGICQWGQNPYNCPVDCTICGDGICGNDETKESCQQDCVTPCGNGVCEGGENPDDCPVDCGLCGDDICGYSETDDSCPADCWEGCGDEECQPWDGESKETCPGDCTSDKDGDGVADEVDNCAAHYNPEQEDFDLDGIGDLCDLDDDDDTDLDASDCAPKNPEISHMAPEICDNLDNDCDGEINNNTCDDDNVCTDDICDPDNGCLNTNNIVPCNDGDSCTLSDQCTDGECASGSAVTCEDGNPCTDNPCLDGDCQVIYFDCFDYDPCTVDWCNPVDGTCGHLPDPTCKGDCNQLGGTAICDDDNACTVDSCVPKLGVCRYSLLGCNDKDPCTDDSCLAETGCQHELIPDCQGCVQAENCNDDDPCSLDSCDEDGQCSSENLPDLTPCPGGPHWTCSQGQCSCSPSCPGKNCGDDGCGGNCGVCPPECGDGACDGNETCHTCSYDCGLCCGNGQCEELFNESCESCQADCGACCGDEVCEPAHGEQCGTCPLDCGMCCGDGECSPLLGESCQTCTVDCGQCCNNGKCDSLLGETACTCSDDCPATCGDGCCSSSEDSDGCPDDCTANCGDDNCQEDLGETCQVCAKDCGKCCGNGLCEQAIGENCATCPSDCGKCCGDGLCNAQAGESCQTCIADCGHCCGDGPCLSTVGETCLTCPKDCDDCCGDGLCQVAAGENCLNCAQDCGTCCGDGQCNAGFGESTCTCPDDCQSLCGDHCCNAGEIPGNCPEDCGAECGDGVCGGGNFENCLSCPADCGICCGDDVCEWQSGESCQTCPEDCGQCCGDGACQLTAGETCFSCPDDCGDCCSNGKCEQSFGENCFACPDDCGQCCGNDLCEGVFGETTCLCPEDCGEQCGDACCNGEETCNTCPQDCSDCCGDGQCILEHGETCNSCPDDCGDCCGNELCETELGETCDTCPADCDECCGDDECNAEHDEDCTTCPADCGMCCGNNVCDIDLLEDCQSCPADCGLCCGNDKCEAGFLEDCETCSNDCGPCCGNGLCDHGETCGACVDCSPCCGDGSCDILNGENSCVCGDDCESELEEDNACADGCCSAWDCQAGCSNDCDLCDDCGNCSDSIGQLESVVHQGGSDYLVTGWACDPDHVDQAVEVQIYDNGGFINITLTASQNRPDQPGGAGCGNLVGFSGTISLTDQGGHAMTAKGLNTDVNEPAAWLEDSICVGICGDWECDNNGCGQDCGSCQQNCTDDGDGTYSGRDGNCTDHICSVLASCPEGYACNGPLTKEDGAICATTCPGDENYCAKDHYCSDVQECMPKRANGQPCLADNECLGANCDSDLAGVKRCHQTAMACVHDQTGNETTSGASFCISQKQWRACNNTIWEEIQDCLGTCQACQAGACFDDDTLCVDSGWDGCDSQCQKVKSNGGTCLAGTCQSETAMVLQGKICSAGSEAAPGPGVNCDSAITCQSNECTGQRYYRGCAADGLSCVDMDKVDGGSWLAPPGTVISETAYKVGDSCSTDVNFCSVSSHCSGDDWYAGYTCDGTGQCNQDYQDQGCCDHTDCAIAAEYCDEATHNCTVVPACSERSLGAYGYGFAPEGNDLWADCDQEPTSTCGLDGECDGNGGCRQWQETTVCTPQSCEAPSTLHDTDFCDGNGGCIDSGTSSCAPYTCNDALDSCRSTCSEPEHCVDGYTCNLGNCEL
jgi:hypothetical protein